MRILKVSQVPDWERRAIRLSLALVFFTSLGITLWLVPEQYRAEWGDEVVQSCNWAGATCAVVAASPLIGKVAQLSYERTLGTFTGGVLGFLVYDYGIQLLPDGVDQMFMVCCAALVGFVSCWLSYKYKLDASMRLFVITFLIVTFGAHNNDSKSALGVALLRTGGIIFGVLLFMLLTIVILPKSATVESLREIKTGLKLLTELNTLVWTSKHEAEAAMKDAAGKARAAQAAADAATANDRQPPIDATSNNKAEHGNGARPLNPLTRWSGWSKSNTASGYVPLPDRDLEAGAVRAAGAAMVEPAAAPVVTAGHAASQDPQASSSSKQPSLKSGKSPVSQLTEALQHSSISSTTPGPVAVERSELLLSGAGLPPIAVSQQQQYCGGVSSQAADKAPGPVYVDIMEQYEVRCEAVLTSVYQSMFKLKEHMQLAESELYVYHFWGHYIFLPMFFNRTIINWLLPGRWHLPGPLLEELATSVRVMARLLWTVHLDYSQGFDDVLAALPPSCNMGNLLTELGEVMSAALAVLVEAFPNKTSILVDSFSKLDVLVDRILEISEASHHNLVQDLAANRPKTVRPVRSSSIPVTPLAALGAAGSTVNPTEGSHGTRFSKHAQADSSRPAVAAVEAAGAGRSLSRTYTEGGSGAANATGLNPSLSMLLQPSRQVSFVTFDGDAMSAPAVAYARTGSQLCGRSSLEGLTAPMPTDSPIILSLQHPAQQRIDLDMPAVTVSAGSDSQAPAAVAGMPADQNNDSNTIFMFDVADSPSGAGQHVSTSPTAIGDGRSQLVGQFPRVHGAAPFTLSESPSTSLIRTKFKPYAVLAAVKLQRSHGVRHANNYESASPFGTAAPAQQKAPRDLLHSLSTVSAPDPAKAKDAALLLQKQHWRSSPFDAAHTTHGTAAGHQAAGVPGGGEAKPLDASMSFVKLTRWYSFQFLLAELVDEMDNLYCCVQKVLSALPHGL